MKYRTKSANVLNEADRYERILNHQMFIMDQERILYFGAGWHPGDPLFQHPDSVVRMSNSGCSCCDDGSEEELEGYYGHHICPMFQTYTIHADIESYRADVSVVADNGTNRLEKHDMFPRMACTDCEVSWRDDHGPCWMCGVFSKPLGPEKEMKYRSVGNSFRLTIDSMRIAMDLSLAEMRSLTGVAIQSDGDLRQPANPQWTGLHQMFSIVDEWTYPDRVFSYNPGTIEPYYPPANPFERDLPERLVLPTASESAAEPLDENPVHPPDAVWRRARRSRVHLSRITPAMLVSQVPNYIVPTPGPLRPLEHLYERDLWTRINPPLTEQRRSRR